MVDKVAQDRLPSEYLFSAVCMSPPLLQAHSIIYPICYIILAADSVVKWHAYSSAKWLSPSHSRPLETKPKTGWIAEPFCTCYCTQSSQWSCPEPNMFGWVHNLTNMAQVNRLIKFHVKIHLCNHATSRLHLWYLDTVQFNAVYRQSLAARFWIAGNFKCIRFDTRASHMGFVMDKSGVQTGLFQGLYFSFPLPFIIAPVFHTCLS